MQQFEVLPRQQPNAQWFEKMRGREQKKTTSRLIDATETALEPLVGKLALPNKVYVGYTSRKVVGLAGDRTISVGEIFYSRYLRSRRLSGAAVGVIGHELSHFSDFKTNNDCSFGQGLIHKTVAEGKAELVGVIVGGEEYLDEHCRAVRQRSKEMAYKQVAGLGTVKERSKMLALNPNVPYIVGVSLVSDVIERTNSEGLFPIHPKNTDFFKQHLLEMIRVYETQT